jgi:hypothetical protein
MCRYRMHKYVALLNYFICYLRYILHFTKYRIVLTILVSIE